MKPVILLGFWFASAISYPLDNETIPISTSELTIEDLDEIKKPEILKDNSQDVLISKQFYVHSAPDEFEDSTTPKSNIRVYFITLLPTQLKDINDLEELRAENVIFLLKKYKSTEKKLLSHHEDSSSTEKSNDDLSNEIIRTSSETLDDYQKKGKLSETMENETTEYGKDHHEISEIR